VLEGEETTLGSNICAELCEMALKKLYYTEMKANRHYYYDYYYTFTVHEVI